MKEYEYSFKVTDIKPYIDYCENENYVKKEESSQIRVLYRNTNNTMARITTKEKNGVKRTFLDFKDDNSAREVLKISRETIPLEVTVENKNAIDSILEMLEYKEDKTLIRNRLVYSNGNVIFELDNYSSPEVMFVVGIEGKKEFVDKVYFELKDKINNMLCE